MKKYSFILVLIIIGFAGFGQPLKEAKNYIPNYIPPSPNVASLMKFEEVPVDLYTGIPDVNIPLFTTNAKNSKVKLNLALKYHPLNIVVDAMAGDTGLGWSLFAGGSISRTVKDLPDDMLFYAHKIGIYQTTIPNSTNNFYNIVAMGVPSNNTEQEMLNEFLWEANEKKKYDTQHDLWQFNFMGFSGRFYIKKNMATGQLEVKPLENYNLKIENFYKTNNDDYPNAPIYSPTSFIITDNDGFKYYFDVVEETKTFTFSDYTYYPGGNYTNYGNDVYNVYHKSAFHLSRIDDLQGNLLIEFQYTNPYFETLWVNRGYTLNEKLFSPYPFLMTLAGSCPTCPSGELSISTLEPESTSFATSSKTNVRKLKQINIQGIGSVKLNYSLGRLDNYYPTTNMGSKIDNIEIYTNVSSTIPKKKYNFIYEYSNHNKRLFLKEIHFVDDVNNTENKYLFDYQENDMSNGVIGEDYWGFYNTDSRICRNGEPFRETTNEYCTTDVLQKITYPTGGSAVFKYEPNEYTYEGNISITNFDKNEKNWEATFFDVVNLQSSSSTPSSYYIGNFSVEKRFSMYCYISNNSGIAGFVSLIKKNSLNQVVDSKYLKDGCLNDITLAPNYNYYLEFRWNNLAQIGADPLPDLPVIGNASIEINELTRIANYKNYLYGGGIRIGKIGYFSASDVNADYYRSGAGITEDVLPSKEISYSYYAENNINESSGSLVFPKPIFEYTKLVKTCFDCGGYPGNSYLQYKVKTPYNNLLSNKTRGADVGYKHVTVKEHGNGKTEYFYTNSLDYPEDVIEYNIQPPFLPLPNIDYKRGLLLKQVSYDNDDKKLTEKINEYEIENYTEEMGFNVFNRDDESFSNSKLFEYYAMFKNIREICAAGNVNYNCTIGSTITPPVINPNIPICPCHCLSNETVPNVILKASVYENFGWSKLKSTTTNNYFNNGSLTNIINNVENYIYNPSNKLLASQETSNSTGETIETKYYYPQDVEMAVEPVAEQLVNKNMIVTPLKTQILKNSTALSEQTTVYKDWGSGLLLPEIIKTKKATNVEEDRMKFISYDSFGNPTCLRMENGMYISYVWGYNNSQPIAKIENKQYSAIPATLITAIQTASNSSVTGLETTLLQSMSNLRNGLSDAMVTTFTYVPLVGVKTITDPKGYTTTYDYDSFGRLSQVKDSNNNIITENQYHYKP
ncbi:MAG: RHS repeat protein [Bacteroidetes bacterium]|uniref:RHS repeat domain-containing protein n=1 Tax=Flavobacterium sp. TaxID=239 RepID=UPI002FD91BD7|nr:RHS repeat protein [Bacteroidota bacterium]